VYIENTPLLQMANQIVYNTVPIDSQINLYRWVENATIFCGGISFGDYWDQLLNGKAPQRLDVKIDESAVTQYLLPELKRDYIGVTGQKVTDNTYEFWFISDPTIKATFVMHPEFVGHGIYCDCNTNAFENVDTGSTVFAWMDQSEPTIQELSVF
jgi:hypothetical protein